MHTVCTNGEPEMPRPARFTIRAASAMTGINPNTLRSWERRYGLLEPQRTPKGYRLYTDNDLERLRLIQRALDSGISIGQVKEHLEDESALKALKEGDGSGGGARSSKTMMVSLENVGLSGSVAVRVPSRDRRQGNIQTLAECSERIEQAALALDRTGLDRAFSRTVGMYSLREAFYDGLAPALRRVGERFLKDPSGIAQEHLLSAFAREKLAASLAGLRPLHQAPRVICACLPEERHDLMLMLMSLELGLENISTLFLGADTPVQSIAEAARQTGVRVIALAATVDLRKPEMEELAKRLRRTRPTPLLAVGGPAASRERDWLGKQNIATLPDDPREAANALVALARSEGPVRKRSA